MNKLAVTALILCGGLGLTWASAPAGSSNGSSDADTLRQMAQDMGDAMIAGDVKTLDQMFADDWVSIGASGKPVTKELVLANIKSGKDKLESFQIEHMDVQVTGSVAAVHGSVTETRRWDGKESSGEFMWTDLLEKRDGRWVVVRSAGLHVK